MSDKIIQFPKPVSDVLKKLQEQAESQNKQVKLSDVLTALSNALKISGNNPIVQNGEFHEFMMRFKVDGETVNFFSSQLLKAEINPVNETKN